MPKTNERMDDARRQGAFEGRIEAKVDGLVLNMDALVKQNTGFDSRLRNIEDGKSGSDEKFKDSDKVHDDLYKQLGAQASVVDGLVKYQSVMRGIIIAIGVVMPVLTSLITAFLIKKFL